MNALKLSRRIVPAMTFRSREQFREPWLTLGLGGFLYVALLATWQWSGVLCALLGAGTAALLATAPSQRYRVLWALATLAGLLGEHWMTQRGVWTYARPDVAGLPLWLIWVWGYLMVTFVRLSDWMYERVSAALTGHPEARHTLRVFGWSLILLYGLIVLLTVHHVAAWCYAVVGGWVALRWRNGRTLALFAVAALLGLVGEASAIAAGVWTYAHPAFTEWGVPISMPLAWGLSAILLVKASDGWVAAARRRESMAAPTRPAVPRELLLLSGIGAYMYAVVLLGWRTPLLATTLLTASWLLLLLHRPSARNVCLCLIALSCGLGLEYVAVARLHLWRYAQPDLGPLASWVVPGVYGAMPILLVRVAESLCAWFRRTAGTRRPMVSRALWWFAYVGCLGYWIATMQHIAPPFATLALVVGAVIFLAPCSGRDLTLFWLAATVPPLMEVGGIRAGLWSYTTPHFAQLGVPLSMPLTWGLLSVLGCRLSEACARRIQRWRAAQHR